MKCLLLSDLARHPEFWHELIPLGELRGGELVLSDELAARLPADVPVQDSGGRPPVPILPAKPVSRAEWPWFIKLLAGIAREDEKGIGDVIARIVGPIGGDAYKEWHQKYFGQPCGCSERQETLNLKYPL